VEPTFRPGTLADAPAVYEVFAQTLADLDRRRGTPEADNTWADPAAVAATWERRGTLFEHLTRSAERFWVAERQGQIVGYARATLRDGVRNLTDFFVLPAHQGVGRRLLARAFPAGGARRRVVLATSAPTALACYLKAGLVPRVPLYPLTAPPRPVDVATGLAFEPLAPGPAALAELRNIDRNLLDFARDADHEFLLGDRQGTLYRRSGRAVGYGYDGKGTGPIALLEASDFPAVLAHAEAGAAARGEQRFGVNVPLVNRAALDYLLARGFQLADVTNFLMSDEPFGDFERYLFTSPPFFV